MLLKSQFEAQGNILFKYRGELPVLLIPPGMVLLYFHMIGTPDFDWANFLSYYKWICLGVVLLGQLIRVYAVGYSAPSTSGRNTQEQVASVVNHTGMYSMVRHPLYLGNYFMALGVAMLSCSIWFVVVYTLLFWIYYERIMYAEEAFISKKFDATLEAWAAKTPSFIPSLALFKKAEGVFKFKKIIRQEKNGILGTFFIFFLFQLVENYALYNEVYRGLDVWSIALLVSAIAYIIIRTLTKKTTALSD
jgi:protein-S-isoprenylcysteine O-methyltransferase Ste14